MEEINTPPPFPQRDAYVYQPTGQMPPQQLHAPINNQTYISLGLFATFVSGIIWLTNTIYSAKNDITTAQILTRNEFANRVDKVEAKVENLSNQLKDVQSHNETWSYSDMFRWCVHFQRDNPQSKVPEPQANK